MANRTVDYANSVTQALARQNPLGRQVARQLQRGAAVNLSDLIFNEYQIHGKPSSTPSNTPVFQLPADASRRYLLIQNLSFAYSNPDPVQPLVYPDGNMVLSFNGPPIGTTSAGTAQSSFLWIAPKGGFYESINDNCPANALFINFNRIINVPSGNAVQLIGYVLEGKLRPTLDDEG